jgi:hypothetical protein
MEKLNILRDSTGPAVVENLGHLEGLLDKIFAVAENQTPTVVCSEILVVGGYTHATDNIVAANTLYANVVTRILKIIPRNRI